MPSHAEVQAAKNQVEDHVDADEDDEGGAKQRGRHDRDYEQTVNGKRDQHNRTMATLAVSRLPIAMCKHSFGLCALLCGSN